MALDNLGSLFLQLIIFITTLVNFNYALASLDALLILMLYFASRLFYISPEHTLLTQCQVAHLYQDV